MFSSNILNSPVSIAKIDLSITGHMVIYGCSTPNRASAQPEGLRIQPENHDGRSSGHKQTLRYKLALTWYRRLRGYTYNYKRKRNGEREHW